MYKIQINLTTRQLTLLDDEKPVGTYPVAIGKPSTPTPAGNFTIINKVVNPGGPFGTRWMAFTSEAHGIHGNNDPSSIGKAVSMGCVRMYNRDVEAIFPLVEIGTPVEIAYGAISSAPAMAASPNSNYLAYTVKPGDSLWLIAQRHGLSVQDIVSVNQINNPHLIYPGDLLKLPQN